jgi:probable addiction module antidote protein
MRKKPSVPLEPILLDELKNPEEAACYLQAAMEDDDPAVFLLALRKVATAHGMARLARKARLGEKSLYKMLSKSGNPELRTVHRLLRAAGLRMDVKAA